MPRVYNINAQPLQNISKYKLRAEYLLRQAMCNTFTPIQSNTYNYMYHGVGVYRLSNESVELTLIDWIE